jgi:gamma-butyrobetaine dioxygenase/trimethyllysine dioxygenase
VSASRSSAPIARIAGVAVGADSVRIDLSGAPISSADFHAFWLRHHCPCCRHPETGERMLCPSRVPLDIVVRSARPVDGGRSLELEFGPLRAESEHHVARFEASWLAEHAYAPDRAPQDPPLAEAMLEVASGPGWAARCLERVRTRGAAIVCGLGEDTEAHVADLEALGLQVVPTHFGRIEDLRTDNTTNANTDQLGYTDAPVDLHTDQPFLDRPPRFQALHCMRPADVGGESAVADGFAAAGALRREDPQAFEVLTSTPVAFHRRQREFERRLEAPIIELEAGEVVRVRASYFTLAPLALPFGSMPAWYRAYQAWVRRIEEPRHHLGFRLEKGDLLLYDNFRVLHARAGFKGARWVRGIYFDPLSPSGPAAGAGMPAGRTPID